MSRPPRLIALVALLLATCAVYADAPIFDVRQFGAAGDGKTADTIALNRAVKACADAGGGVVVVPPGRYLTGTIRLLSNVTLRLENGAEIVGTSDLDAYQNFNPPDSTPLADRNRWHRALILGVGVENAGIVGRGTINGNKVFDPRGEERMRGPHAILLGNCRHITLRDFSITDAANYAIMLEFTSDVDVHGLTITGGWDGVHFRGWKGNPCRNISITDCRLFTGDDCIAGWYWENTLIANCIINSSCNGIRLIGPATGLIIHDCLFFGPGRFEHRTSRDKHRRNMLAGLCLQPGAWDHTEGPLDDVHISNITMHDVTTPLHFSLKPGNTAGRITIDRLTATGAYRAAASIESWAENPIEHVTLRDVSLSFTGGGTPEQARMIVRSPGVDARPLPAWGIYARNVARLDLQNVRLTLENADARPALIARDVGRLDLDTFRIPKSAGSPLRLTGVGDLRLDDAPIAMATARCIELKTSANPPAATATVENGATEGLAQVQLLLDDKPLTRWLYLSAGQKQDVTFTLPALKPGRHSFRCGSITQELAIP